MTAELSRRALLLSAASVLPVANARPKGTLIDTHVHLFASDQKQFPYHKNAAYRPPAHPLEKYLDFVRAANIDGVIIVHP